MKILFIYKNFNMYVYIYVCAYVYKYGLKKKTDNHHLSRVY